MISVLATLAAFALIVVIAVLTARGPQGATPDRGTLSGALDAASMEVEAQAAIAAPPMHDPDLLELARLHAYALATRGFEGEVDPEGEDHLARRTRLCPLFVGWSEESAASLSAAPGLRERELAKLLIAGLRPSVSARACVLGAGAEGRRVTLVVISGERVATLSSAPLVGVEHGPYSLDGMMAPGRRPEELTATVTVGALAPVPFGVGRAKGAPSEEGDAPQRFLLEGELAPGSGPATLRVECGGRVVLTVPLRG